MSSTAPPAGLTPEELRLHEAAVEHLGLTTPTTPGHVRRDAETILNALAELGRRREENSAPPAEVPSWADGAEAVDRRIRILAGEADDIGNLDPEDVLAYAKELETLVRVLPELERRRARTQHEPFVRIPVADAEAAIQVRAAARALVAAVPAAGLTSDDFAGRYEPLRGPLDALYAALGEEE